MSTLVTATDLVVRYNEQVVLDGATLAIEEGDRLGLVGRNGSGKTTLLRILAGLQLPTSGVVSKRRDLVISYLSQDFTLDAALNVYENIRSGAQHVLDPVAASAGTRCSSPSTALPSRRSTVPPPASTSLAARLPRAASD